ncbi:MAG: magnesium transporter [Verrucomicrobiota bacterium]|nr:magnesium transporter [Verrucomicrobiota bacterium]
MTENYIDIEKIKKLIENGLLEELRLLVEQLDPADVADVLEDLNEDEQVFLFDTLAVEIAAETIVEIEGGTLYDLIDNFSLQQIVSFISNMAPDNAVDFLLKCELTNEKKIEILNKIEPEKHRNDIKILLKYKDDSGGSIMTPELCALPASTTAEAALKAIGKAELSDPILQIFVIQPTSGSLLGYIHLSTLLSVPGNTHLDDIIERDYVSTTPEADQEEIARDFRKYNIWCMPVVDHENRLVGRITADDIMEVMQEEANENMAFMVGAPDYEENEDSAFKAALMRFPWLMLTLFAGIINSLIIKEMLDVTNVAAIAIFVPVIMAMGGNTGIQASAISIREIAEGKEGMQKLLSIAWRQILVGAFMGIACAFLSAAGAFFVLSSKGLDLGTLTPGNLSFVIGLSMFNAMIFASVFGGVFPIILHRLKVDPALASGPFVTTSNDLSASLIYFLTCVLLLM